KPLRHGARVRFHHGTAELLARVALATEYTGPAPAADDTEHADHQGKGAADDTEHADHQGKGAADDAEHADHQGKGATDDKESAIVELQPGRRAFARVRLEAPAVLARGDRFVIRQYSPAITIGGGSVLDPLPARSPIRTPAAVKRFARLASSDGEA